ncbi:histidine phosphatase family protein [Candidatus Saccharibacteria bacterium]|nr:histidine phosphatase family protein [Candidatus Saccharibacteria bacterium]
MKLYLARHGETDWNLQHKMQGQVDVPLNKTGIKQAKKLKETLKNYNFDICYCSPLKRAIKTAEIATDGRTKIIFDDNLKERSYGKLEGKHSVDDFNQDINASQDGMEPIKDLLARSQKVLDRLKAENPPNAKILVVGHGTMFKALHFVIVGYDDNTDFSSFNIIKNGAIDEYDI